MFLRTELYTNILDSYNRTRPFFFIRLPWSYYISLGAIFHQRLSAVGLVIIITLPAYGIVKTDVITLYKNAAKSLLVT